jgi:RNA polymerase sigma-70 factor, ECF subfamily
MALDDSHLLALVRDGNRDLFAVLMQQTYLRAFLHLDQLGDDAKLSGWLARIAANEALTRLRQRRRLAEDELGDAEEEIEMPVPRSPETALSERELGALLEAALGDLPEMYRAVFVLREVEGMSTDEVAAALSVSAQVVKTRLFRAKDLLRRRLYDRTGRAAPEVFTFEAPRCDRVVAAVLARLPRNDH